MVRARYDGHVVVCPKPGLLRGRCRAACVAAYHQTAAYKKAYQKRKVWVEPLFGEGQQWHGVRRFRLRGLAKVKCEGVITATGHNLKRLLSWRGWGRRHFPGAAHGVVLPYNDAARCV